MMRSLNINLTRIGQTNLDKPETKTWDKNADKNKDLYLTKKAWPDKKSFTFTKNVKHFLFQKEKLFLYQAFFVSKKKKKHFLLLF